jgi:hypothetical protein
MADEVAPVAEIGIATLRELLRPYALQVDVLSSGATIPGSYWGESEAGLIGNVLYVREDTPVHSALHEAAHFVCMDSRRREQLQQDAGGDHPEENAVCYLQILWADTLPGFSRERMWRDMDVWGYTFRLGSARRWFEEDAQDARDWLIAHGVIDAQGRITGRRRE